MRLSALDVRRTERRGAGHREAVVIAADDLDALEDTLDILSSPAAVREIAEAREAAARGEGLDRAEVRRRYLGHHA